MVKTSQLLSLSPFISHFTANLPSFFSLSLTKSHLYPRLDLNSESSCLHLPCIGIVDFVSPTMPDYSANFALHVVFPGWMLGFERLRSMYDV